MKLHDATRGLGLVIIVATLGCASDPPVDSGKHVPGALCQPCGGSDGLSCASNAPTLSCDSTSTKCMPSKPITGCDVTPSLCPTGMTCVASTCFCAVPVTPVKATFTQATFSTAYSIDVHVSPAEPITVEWSGPNCGVFTPNTPTTSAAVTDLTSTMTWTHAHPPCDATTDHKDVKITVKVTSAHLAIQCTYQGADSGAGPACVAL